MSVLPLKADIFEREWHVRYVKADIKAADVPAPRPLPSAAAVLLAGFRAMWRDRLNLLNLTGAFLQLTATNGGQALSATRRILGEGSTAQWPARFDHLHREVRLSQSTWLSKVAGVVAP